jgi:hypothetical protein
LTTGHFMKGFFFEETSFVKMLFDKRSFDEKM